jgi:hypothetical protein
VLHRGLAPHCNYSICLHSAFSMSQTPLFSLFYLPLIPRIVSPSFLISFSLYSFLSESKEWIQYIIGVGCSHDCGGLAWDRWGLVAAAHHTGALWCQWGGRVFLTHPSLWLVFHPLRLAIGNPCAPFQVSSAVVCVLTVWSFGKKIKCPPESVTPQ